MLKQYTGFDHENVLKPGTPIRVTKLATSTESESSFYALIQYSTPIKLQIVTYTASQYTIMLEDVISGKCTIEPLVYEEVK